MILWIVRYIDVSQCRDLKRKTYVPRMLDSVLLDIEVISLGERFFIRMVYHGFSFLLASFYHTVRGRVSQGMTIFGNINPADIPLRQSSLRQCSLAPSVIFCQMGSHMSDDAHAFVLFFSEQLR